MKFNSENKQVKEFTNNFIPFGVSKLTIALLDLAATKDGKEYIEITVMDPDDGEITDTARLWFTSDAATNYSFNILRQIYVHNAPEAKKDEARAGFDAVTDTVALTELVQKLIGGECWFTKYYDPERTYTAQDGSVKKSVNKNVYGYQPKLNPALMPAPRDNGTELTKDNVAQSYPDDEVPFESKNDAPGSHVPKDEDWSN